MMASTRDFRRVFSYPEYRPSEVEKDMLPFTGFGGDWYYEAWTAPQSAMTREDFDDMCMSTYRRVEYLRTGIMMPPRWPPPTPCAAFVSLEGLASALDVSLTLMDVVAHWCHAKYPTNDDAYRSVFGDAVEPGSVTELGDFRLYNPDGLTQSGNQWDMTFSAVVSGIPHYYGIKYGTS